MTDEELMKRLRSKTPNMVTGHAAMEEAATRIAELLAERDWYRDRVVWGFYEDREPEYYQGKEGESEICDPVTAEQVTRLLRGWIDTEATLANVIAAFRANMIMKSDQYTHEAFDALIAELKGKKNETLDRL